MTLSYSHMVNIAGILYYNCSLVIDIQCARYKNAFNFIKQPTKSCCSIFFNPLPDDKLLGLSKLKAFADDKLNVTQNIKVVFHSTENIVRKEENAGYQHFLLFPQCFQNAFSSSALKVVIVW